MSDMVLDYQLRPFTVDEYHKMAQTGIIADEERVELLDGYLVEMPPIGLRHWNSHARIVRYLIEALGNRAAIVGQGSFPLGSRSEPQPDVAVLAPRPYERDGRAPFPYEILVLVEIAESSLAKDLGPKLQLYARHGIADYIVVDIDGNRLLHHAGPHDLGYERCAALGYGDEFTLAAFPTIPLDATGFLRER